MTAKSNGRERLYEALANQLIGDIAADVYPVGALLPPELELTRQHGLSRQTVRQALQVLTRLGLVVRQPGVGTRVVRSKAASSYSYSMDSITDLSEYARDARLVIDSLKRLAVRGKVAKYLECRDGTSWIRLFGRRVHEGDGAPLAVSDIYLRAIFPGIEDRLRAISKPIHVLLEQSYGEVVETIRQDVRAVSIAPADALVLGVPEQSPGLEAVRRYYSPSGMLVLAGRVLHPAERFSYAMTFKRSDVVHD